MDEAVWFFGTAVEGRIREASKSKGKNDNEAAQAWRAEDALRRSLGLTRKFASPAPTQ